MSNFIEFDENTKVLKSISLEDFNIEDFEEYTHSLVFKIDRDNEEIYKNKNKRRGTEIF